MKKMMKNNKEQTDFLTTIYEGLTEICKTTQEQNLSDEEFKEKVRNELLDADLENMIDDVLANIDTLVIGNFASNQFNLFKSDTFSSFNSVISCS
jgi:hypothetical protein